MSFCRISTSAGEGCRRARRPAPESRGAHPPGTAYSSPIGTTGGRGDMKATTIAKTVLGMAVLGAVVAGPVAEASNPTVVTGTTQDDQIQGLNGPQIIYGLAG